MLGYLKEHGYRNVGVLKFRVQKGDEPVSDHVGTLNLDLAARLEVALVLTTDIKVPLGIIHDASAVAAKIPGANHLNEPGRRALLGARYPLAWGGEQVEPDAFLTGVAQVSPDLKTVTMSILAFGRDGGKLEKVADFTATTDPPMLTAAGESFVLTRGLFDEGQVKMTKVVEIALKVKAQQALNPIQSAERPWRWRSSTTAGPSRWRSGAVRAGPRAARGAEGHARAAEDRRDARPLWRRPHGQR